VPHAVCGEDTATVDGPILDQVERDPSAGVEKEWDTGAKENRVNIDSDFINDTGGEE
jgi:hypothetical protein